MAAAPLPAAPMEHAVFISYSSADRAAAETICAALEAAAHGCWMAPRDIPAGVDYPAAILGAIQNARAVVVVISAEAAVSPHVLTEIGHAFSQKKPLIPFRLSSAQLPPDLDYFLSLSQWLDAHEGCTPKNLARLEEAVSQALRGGSHAPIVRKAPLLDRRIIFAGAGVLAVAGVMLLGWLNWPRIEAKAPARGSPPEQTKTGASETAPRPWINPKDGLTYVWIPPGSFTMGCSPGDTECQPDEGPAHRVDLTSGFWLGQTEVTNAAYERVTARHDAPAAEVKLPAVGISWSEAKAYCAAVGGRLPTEAEWEYAARGGTSTAYYGAPSKIAWFGGNSGGARHAVATREPNAYGLYDMLGNASEWVLDRYYRKYDPDAPAAGEVEQPLAGNASALARGGFWESEAPNIRVSRRAEMDNSEPGPMVGIRCVVERQ